MKIALLEDNDMLRSHLARHLSRAGHDVGTAGSLAEVRPLLLGGTFDAIVADMHLPDGIGIGALELPPGRPCPSLIVVTGDCTPATARSAVRGDAVDYLVKPFGPDALLAALGRISARAEWQACHAPELVGTTAALVRTLDACRKLCTTSAPVMITGERGTLRRHYARAMHSGSGSLGPFVSLALGGIPSAELEPAVGRRLTEARGGSILLEDPDDLPEAAQRQLAAVAAAAGMALGQRIYALCSPTGRFAELLRGRGPTERIEVAPLRERVRDVPSIARRAAVAAGAAGVEDDVMAVLAAHPWPGNDLELIGAVETMAGVAGPGETIRLAHVPPRVRAEAGSRRAEA